MGEWEESQRQTGSSVNPARKICSARDGFCWCLLWWQKGGCILSTSKLKLTTRITLVIILLLKLVEDCNQLLPTGLPFSRTVRTAQDLLQANCLDFIAKDQWPPLALPDLNPMDYHVWGDVGGLSQSTSKTKVNHRTQASAAWGSGTAFHRNQSTRLSKAFQND